MPTIPPPNLLPPMPNIRPNNTLIPILRQPQIDQPKIIIQSLRIQQAHAPPVLIHAELQIRIGVVQLALQVLQLAGVERRAAVVVLVEGVVGQALQVGEVGVVAHGFEVFEHADDVVAGVVEDPVAVVWIKMQWLAKAGRAMHVQAWELTGSAARPSIDLVLAGEHAGDSRLREDTPGMEEHRR